MASTDEIMARAVKSAIEFKKLNQEQTDNIVHKIYLAAMNNRVKLAKIAIEETGIGIWQHKVIKNVIASLLVYEHIKHQKTVGVIFSDPYTGIIELALPLGPILALVPVINPTSTTIFKILIAMKTRNPIIICSSAACKNCVSETANICYEAAIEAGAPRHCIQWIEKPNMMKAKELMGKRELALILATGTHELVKASYSSGTPTIGVSSGNVPVYIGTSADIPFAVYHILYSKTFDNGSVCASEQAIVATKENADAIINEFKKQGAYFLNKDEIEKVGKIAFDKEKKTMTASIVGQSVQRIAEMAGIKIPEQTSVLIAILEGVGPDYALSAEILAPILAFYIEEDFESAIKRCIEITQFGGIGHTAAIYSNNPERIEYFSKALDVARILVNTPTTHGALGGMFNILVPSFTLSCGSGGKNSTTDNITTKHLLNIHRICRRNINNKWFNFDIRKFLNESIPANIIEQEYHKNY